MWDLVRRKLILNSRSYFLSLTLSCYGEVRKLLPTQLQTPSSPWYSALSQAQSNGASPEMAQNPKTLGQSKYTLLETVLTGFSHGGNGLSALLF